jgi:hypothetical protein
MRSAVICILCAAALAGQPQTPPKTEGARDLFFVGAAPKDELPAIKKAPAPVAAPAKKAAAPAAKPATASGAMHLGIRYTLLLVNSGVGEPVDPSRNFKKGDCVALQLEANRSGYLYVLAKESGGTWSPLFPTPELLNQDNRVDPGRAVRAPSESCFEIDDPPGAETLFVVLSREPREIAELADSIKLPKGQEKAATPLTVTAAVEQLNKEYGTRDLPFMEVAKPAAAPPKTAPKAPVAKEPPHAVYVVNGAPKPASTLVTKIEISHR